MAFDAGAAASEDVGAGGAGGSKGGQGLDAEMEAAMARLLAERARQYEAEAEKAVRAVCTCVSPP